MADIHIREIDNQLYKELRARAKRHGVSVEEEARHILQSAVSAPEKLDTPYPVLTWDDHLATAVTIEGRSAGETVYADRNGRC